MRVWLDDERPMPAGYDVHVRTAAEAIALLATGEVAAIALDNDLGPVAAGQGYDVAKYIEEHAFKGALPRLQWSVHTANPSARKLIRAAMRAADRYWHRNESTKEAKPDDSDADRDHFRGAERGRSRRPEGGEAPRPGRRGHDAEGLDDVGGAPP